MKIIKQTCKYILVISLFSIIFSACGSIEGGGNFDSNDDSSPTNPPVTINSGDFHNIYVWFRDTAGNISESAQDSITLNEDTPDQEINLLGTWKSQLRNNRWEMTVTWNESKYRYEGVLTKQGKGSKAVGFTLGEIVWKATPTDNPDELEEQQMWRSSSTHYGWFTGIVYLSRSSNALLVTTYSKFDRANE